MLHFDTKSWRTLPLLVAPGDQLDTMRESTAEVPSRLQLMHMLRGRSATDLDPAVLEALARTDGATVMDGSGRLLAVGAILLHTEPPEPHSNLVVEGARTTAAMAAGSAHGMPPRTRESPFTDEMVPDVGDACPRVRRPAGSERQSVCSRSRASARMTGSATLASAAATRPTASMAPATAKAERVGKGRVLR